MNKFRFLVTGSDNIYQWWMAELLIKSHEKVNQKESITFLWACKDPKNPQYLPTKHEVITTPLYENTTTGYYVPMNRIAGVKHWLHNTIIPEDYIVVLDADMIFLTNFRIQDWHPLNECHVTCGKDIYRYPLDKFSHQVYNTWAKDENVNKIYNPSIVPLILHKDTLLCLANDWEQMTLDIRKLGNGIKKYPGSILWTAELYAWDILCYNNDIDVNCTKNIWKSSWDIFDDNRIPFLHYFGDINNSTRTWTFRKYDYNRLVPTNLKIPNNICGTHRYFFDILISCFGGEYYDHIFFNNKFGMLNHKKKYHG